MKPVRRAFGAILLLGGVLISCADEKAVNAAFFQNKVSWYVFSPTDAGVEPLAGFDQPLKVEWKAASAAMFATDLADTGEGVGAVAVSGLGMLILDDSTGLLDVQRPESEPSLVGYRTGQMFRWKKKTFVTLYREASAPTGAPSVSLAWWAAGNKRLAFYPIPSQAGDAARQAVAVFVGGLIESPAFLDLVWEFPQGDGWGSDATRLILDNGTETPLAEAPKDLPPESLPPADDALVQRLTAKLGNNLTLISTGGWEVATGQDHRLLLTPSGWVAVGTSDGQGSRLYRLPDIGSAGQYTHALALQRGYLITWETRARGFVGAAGMVYVPYAVLAP